MEGFYIHTVDDGRIIPFEQVELAKNNAIDVGQAMLYFNEYVNGPFDAMAEKAPSHISMCKREASGEEQMISAVRVSPDIEFEVESTANLELHSRAGVSSDGKTVVAADMDPMKVCTITNKEALTNGTYKYRVRFN